METGGRALASPGDSPTKAEGNVVPAKAGAGAPETPAAVQVRAAFGPGGAAPSVGVTPPLPPSPALSLCVVPSLDAIEGGRHSAGPPGRGAHSASGAARPAVRAALRASLLFGGKSKPEAPGALGADQPAKAPPAASAEGPGAARSEQGSREDPRGPGSESPRPASCARSLSPARCPPHHEFPGACALLCV